MHIENGGVCVLFSGPECQMSGYSVVWIGLTEDLIPPRKDNVVCCMVEAFGVFIEFNTKKSESLKNSAMGSGLVNFDPVEVL